MDLREAIAMRRSVRSFQDKELPLEIINELISLSIHAPSASNVQPWAFALIENQDLMKEWSDKSKEMILNLIGQRPQMQRYKGMMEKKEFNIFYNAPCLLLIYGNTVAPYHIYDCSMVAQNIMLLAHEAGLGSCWIGFAHYYANSDEAKERLNIPPEYSVVAPIILGYPVKNLAPSERSEPIIFTRVK